MIDLQTVQHDLRRDFQNIFSTLKFVKEEVEIKDEDLKSMVELSLQKEQALIELLNRLFEHSKRKEV